MASEVSRTRRVLAWLWRFGVRGKDRAETTCNLIYWAVVVALSVTWRGNWTTAVIVGAVAIVACEFLGGVLREADPSGFGRPYREVAQREVNGG